MKGMQNASTSVRRRRCDVEQAYIFNGSREKKNNSNEERFDENLSAIVRLAVKELSQSG